MLHILPSICQLSFNLFIFIIPAFLLLNRSALAQVANSSSTNSTSTLPSNLVNLPGFDPAANNLTSQRSNQTYSNPGTNSRIPTTISDTCQKFLAHLNSNPNITTCTTPLLNATTAFSSGPQSVTRAQVKNAFDGLCGPSSGSGCAPHMMYTILNQFAGNCSQELQSGVQVVRMLYDVLYILTPYRVALCSKDPTTGDYCPSVIASSVVNGTSSAKDSKSANMTAADFGAMVNSVFGGKLVTQLGSSSLTNDHPVLQTRDVSNQTFNSYGQHGNTTNQLNSTSQNVYNPNPETYTNANLAFLFLNPNLPDSALCAPCSQSVMAAYIGFEQATPHIGGLSSSAYLSGQLKLWKSISSRCGQKFIESINNEAGIMSILTSTSAAASALFRSLSTSDYIPIFGLIWISFKSFDFL